MVTRQAGGPRAPPIRILLAEDHQTVREALRLLIERQADMVVVAEESTGGSAVERSRDLQPDVAIVDLAMPEMNGLDAVKAICQQAPAVAVVAFTRYDDPAFVDELLSAGARGYVLKQSRSVELLNAIRAAARGQGYIDTALAARRPTNASDMARRIISPREETILRLLASGHRNRDVATCSGHQHQNGRGAPIQRDVQARTARSPRCDALRHAQGLVGGGRLQRGTPRPDRDAG